MRSSRLAERLPESGLPPSKLLTVQSSIAKVTMASGDQVKKGIAGVMVSNGRDVVITDDDGRWSLPVDAGDTIFTVTPPHWTALTRGPAAFSYLHQPNGTPAELGLRSPVLAHTGALQHQSTSPCSGRHNLPASKPCCSPTPRRRMPRS